MGTTGKVLFIVLLIAIVGRLYFSAIIFYMLKTGKAISFLPPWREQK